MSNLKTTKKRKEKWFSNCQSCKSKNLVLTTIYKDDFERYKAGESVLMVSNPLNPSAISFLVCDDCKTIVK